MNPSLSFSQRQKQLDFFYDEETRTKIRNNGWESPRPAIGLNEKPILNNNSGEDFLFMYRQMIGFVNRMLGHISDPQYPKVEGWKTIP